MCQHFLISQIIAQANNIVKMVVREQEEHRRLLAYVRNEDAQCLQQHSILFRTVMLPQAIVTASGYWWNVL
jgi:ABC-type microcin C transport system permease subunit YejE